MTHPTGEFPSPIAEMASELAREILAARTTGDEALVAQTISLAIAAMVAEPALLPVLLLAQAYLTWAVLCGSAVESLGLDSSGEDFAREHWEREVWERMQGLFEVTSSAGAASC